MTNKQCVNHPGATDHDTAHCPMRYGTLDPQQRLDVARGQPAPSVAGMDDHFREPTEMVAGMDGWRLVPVEPTEEMWGGLARDLMMWLDFGNPTVEALRKHLRMLGVEWPAWMNAESEMQGSGVPSKGTRATLIYKAMLSAAPVPPVQGEPVVPPMSAEAVSTLRGMVDYCLNQRVCLGMDEGFASFEPEIEHDFVKELRAFAESTPQPPAQADEREAVTMQQVLTAYDYATEHPDKYLRGTTNWCAAFAHKLNEQFGAAWQRTQASPAPSADGGKVESDEVRRDAERYRHLVSSGHFTPSSFGNRWALRMAGDAASKAELDAVVDAALSAHRGEGERG